MASKTMTIRDEVYYKLKAGKREDESFSDYLERLEESKKPDYFKIVGILSEKEAEKLSRTIKKNRKDNLRLSEERRKSLWSQ